MTTYFVQVKVVNNFNILAFSDEGNAPDVAGKADGDEQQTAVNRFKIE